jgi:hypothetical protein
MRTGPVTAEKRLRRLAATILAAAVASLSLMLPSAAQARWLRAESAHFIVYGPGSKGEIREYAEKLEDFENLLRNYHRLEAETGVQRKLTVYMVNSLPQLRRFTPAATSTSGGFYSVGKADVIAVVRTDLNADDFVIFHEYTHHFMYQHFPYGYPAWMVEGYAEYFGSTQIRDRQIDVGLPSAFRGNALLTGVPLKMSDLLTKRPSDLKTTERLMFYAQSWRLIHYMLSDPERKKQIGAYLRAVRGGADPAEAMAKATGFDLQTLGRKLNNYDQIPYTQLKRKPPADADVTIVELPASADDLLILSARPQEDVPEADRPAFLETVRKAAVKYPDDRLAQLTLARTEIAFGKRDAGEAILRRLLTLDPDDADALREMGLSRIAAGDADADQRERLYKEARPYLVKAYKKDPTSYQTLYAYARSRLVDADYPSANTLTTLLEARALAPQVPEITFSTAEALIRRDRGDEARIILTPMLNDPHRTESAAAAKALLARIKPDAEPAKAAPAT